jgi:hypothetical protein
LAVLGFELGLMQALYHLSNFASPVFVLGIFKIASLKLFTGAGSILLISASPVAKIIGMSHQRPANKTLSEKQNTNKRAGSMV